VLAKLYSVAKPRPMWLVVWQNPLRLDSRGHARRERKHFQLREDAETYQKTLNRQLITEGAAGITFEAGLRVDAIAARERLNAAGHSAVTLLSLADTFLTQAKRTDNGSDPINPVFLSFLADKEIVEGCATATITNLKNRIWPWITRERIATVGDITRERIESIRRRENVSANSRRNDMAAVSVFCTWLIEQGKLAHHPVKGIRRPKVPIGPKEIYTAEQCHKLLETAQEFHDGQWLATITVMLFVGGARPSEVAHTRIFYDRHPTARIEGGKLRGRANRTVNLGPAAVAWLKAADSPETVKPLNSRARNELMARSGLRYTADVLRHTCISMRQQIEANDGAVARECGTSEGIIYRHYHRLVALAEARKWAALRPKRELTAPAGKASVKK